MKSMNCVQSCSNLSIMMKPSHLEKTSYFYHQRNSLPGHTDLSQRKGVDVPLPLACVLPIQHQLWWQELRVLPINLANRLVGNEFVKNGMKIIFKMASNKFIDNKKGLAMLVFAELVMEMLDQPEEQLHNVRGVAIEKREFLKALTADFTSRLKQAQTDKILVWDFA